MGIFVKGRRRPGGRTVEARLNSRPFLEGDYTGIVVNRESDFHSEWQVFDLEQPASIVVVATFTDADDDGSGWGGLEGTVAPGVKVEVSFNGDDWSPLASTQLLHFDTSATDSEDGPVGLTLGYMAHTPRFIRFRFVLFDAFGGDIYSGDADPSFTADYHYVAS